MKKVLFTLFVLAFVSVSVFAQGPQQGRQQDRRFTLPKELNLTEEQQKKVDVVNADFKTKFEEVRKQSDLSREDRRSKMKDINEKYDAAIKEILTPEQQTKLKEMREKRQKEMGSRRGQRNRDKNNQ